MILSFVDEKTELNTGFHVRILRPTSVYFSTVLTCLYTVMFLARTPVDSVGRA